MSDLCQLRRLIKDLYQVKYERLSVLCANCGLLGHWYEVCGAGKHDVTKFKCGDFILADEGRGRSGGRGPGHGSGRGRGGMPLVEVLEEEIIIW